MATSLARSGWNFKLDGCVTWLLFCIAGQVESGLTGETAMPTANPQLLGCRRAGDGPSDVLNHHLAKDGSDRAESNQTTQMCQLYVLERVRWIDASAPVGKFHHSGIHPDRQPWPSRATAVTPAEPGGKADQLSLSVARH